MFNHLSLDHSGLTSLTLADAGGRFFFKKNEKSNKKLIMHLLF